MPHKKNPDVFELIRAKCNKIQSLPVEISLITSNLSTGYFRDLQLIKENFFPTFTILNSCLEMMQLMLTQVIVNEDIVGEEKFKYIFSVDAVNQYVTEGLTFRDAYREVGRNIAGNTFNPPKNTVHTHIGSMGNLCNEKIVQRMEKQIGEFDFDKADIAIHNLINKKYLCCTK